MMPAQHTERYEQLVMLTLKEIFGEINSAVYARVRPCMTTIEVQGGTVLLQQGAPSDSIYLVLSGRLRATRHDDEHGSITLGDIGRGEPIGEMGVISDAPRSATVTALRDCVLLRLAASDFTELLGTWPDLALPLARKLIQRLTGSTQTQKHRRHVVNLCLLPLHPYLNLRALGENLRATLLQQLQAAADVVPGAALSISLITQDTLAQAMGQPFLQLHELSEAQHHQFLAWLDAQESMHTMQVFLADHEDTAWTRLCLRHADHTLLTADADGPAEMIEIERTSMAGNTAAMTTTQSLWLLHPKERRNPTNTMRWLSARPHIAVEGLSHFHTRIGHAQDWNRLARILTGQATGLVLAGGGARGFAHMGVMQVLEENHIEWDMAGGTSIGAVMAAYAAMNLPAREATTLAGAAFAVNPTGDLNLLPWHYREPGQRLAAVIRNAVTSAVGSPIGIEDLWKPYFCVASNYSRAVAQVLRTGDLAHAITASVSIPAALPPVLWRGDLLTDGGTFNNYPVDVMRASGAARVIGVNLSNNRHRPFTIKEIPSSFSLFVDRFFRSRSKRQYKGLPNIATVIINVAAMSSRSHEKRMHDEVDLAFSPDVSQIGMLQWGAFEKVVALGADHARMRLAEAGQATLALDTQDAQPAPPGLSHD